MPEKTAHTGRLWLTNTLSRKNDLFRSRSDAEVKLFTCGPSVYRLPHIGNYRTFLYEDLLERYLGYLGYRVRRIINFTDVEDKAMDLARREGKTREELTAPIVAQFHEDCAFLKIALPDVIPRSSTSVPEAARLARTLVEMGYAYWHRGDVFFDPLKFPGFGRLYGLDMRRWPKKKIRFRKDNYPGERWNLGDFILWEGYKGNREDLENGFYWETEIGTGRPAWNIQDPAMISKHLGMEIDLSCGGVDNLFRHHDYNLAIMESISGKTLAPYWLHGEHVLIDGVKMSKSKGNIVYPKDLASRGYTASQIRFFLVYRHYRKKRNLTAASMRDAARKLDRFQETVSDVLAEEGLADTTETAAGDPVAGIREDFEKGMGDDLDVQAAFDALANRMDRLWALKKEQKLAAGDVARIRRELESLDRVWRFVFK